MKDAFTATAPAPDERVVPCEIRSDKIVIGPAYVLAYDLQEPPAHEIPAAEREQEITRFRDALRRSVETYEQREEQAKTSLPVEILDEALSMLGAEAMLLQDHGAHKKIETAIQGGKSAARAAYDCFKAVSNMMAASGNKKMQGIAHAVDSVLLTILQQLEPDAAPATLADAPDGCIPVTHILSVGMTSNFRSSEGGTRIHGMINSGGTDEDHTNIVARALGLALARVAAPELAGLENGDVIVIDGAANKIIVNPLPATLESYRKQSAAKAAAHEALAEKSRQDDGVPQTRDGQAIRVAANISYSDEVRDVNAVKAGGIGLYRTELALQRANSPITEGKWHKIFTDIVSRTENGKVIIRTADFDGDKANESYDEAAIDEIIRRQMAAAIRVAHEQGHDRVGVMIPVVHSAAHLQSFQEKMDAEAARLGLETIRAGAMVEVADFIGDLDNADAAFFSIGTNDLISDIIRFNRFDHEERNRLYDPADPRVLNAIAATAASGGAKDIPVSVCGDMGSDPRYFALLVGAGIRNLSVGAASVPVIKELARRIDTQQARALFEKILTLDKKEDRLALLDSFNSANLGLQNRVLSPQWPPAAPPPGFQPV